MNTPPSASDLQKQYIDKTAEYETVLQRALANNDLSDLPRLRKLNQEISQLLEKLLNELQTTPQKIQVEREELVSTLNRIQRDYNGLKNSTDDLTLLRRIRQGETGASQKEFQFYLGVFFALCLGILAMVFFGNQMKEATAISTPTPSSTAPLL